MSAGQPHNGTDPQAHELRMVSTWDYLGEIVREKLCDAADRIDRDAARLRSLAARMDSHLNRGRSFTGAEVAAMLRDGGPADDSDIMPGSEFDGPVVL